MREKLVKSIRSVTGQINLDEGRRERLTPEQLGVREERKAYKQALVNYSNAFMPHLKQRRQQGQRERRGRQGRGIFFYNTSQELLNRLELLDGSLRAGNNGTLPEYIQIAHRLRDIGSVSNKELNALLRKYKDL